MESSVLISAAELAAMMDERRCVVFDCRFDLRHPQGGRNSWLASHIPGAVYAHLDDNLSGRVTAQSGRHPLPLARSFAAFLARSGWEPGLQAVAYDAQGGALASRLWWLMRYFGLGDARLLDGGISAWRQAGLPLEAGEVTAPRKTAAELVAHPALAIGAQALARLLENRQVTLIDARAGSRFRGEVEPIDAVAGHIPGAVNRPYKLNLLSDGRFKQAAALKNEFTQLIGRAGASEVVHMCGSGVTACHNLLAMELAGQHGSRLYVGSWSEWIRDPLRPVAVAGG